MQDKKEITERSGSFILLRRSKKKRIALGIFFCFCVIAVFHCEPFVNKVTTSLKFYSNSLKVKVVEALDGFYDFIANFRYFVTNDINSILINLRNENLRLQYENLRLQCQINQLEKIKSENENLKKILSINESNKGSFKTARVVTIFSNDFARTCVLNAGRSEGISVDDVVLDSDGLIGRVIEVQENWCNVLLITDASSNVPVKIGEHDVNAIISGNNSDKLRVAVVREDVQLKKDDIVKTSGYGEIFDEKIPIGKLIEKKGKLMVKPFVNFNSLKYVNVLKKNVRN